jgi:hypothetical protein
MKTMTFVVLGTALVCLLAATTRAQVNWSAKWIVQNRANHAMAYDSGRQRVVLFGGETYGQVLGDTWEWDGTDWTQVFPQSSPPARAEHSMTYDAARGVVTLFGGRDAAGAWTNELWEWDGVTWIQRVPSGPAPPAVQMYPCSITYDAARGRAVTVVGSLFSPMDEIWEWDGNEWILALSGFPITSGTGWSIIGGTVAYDAARQVTVVVVGGIQGAEKTYLWDGATLAAQPGLPPSGAMAYDPARGKVVVYEPLLNETHEWNGETWVKVIPATSPPDRVGPALVYDGTRSQILLVGGQSAGSNPAPLFDTWVWDGINWGERVPFSSPPAGGVGQNLAYDAARDRIVYSGFGTWEWNGTEWDQRHPMLEPPTRFGTAATYVNSIRRVGLFGGYASFPSALNDFWLWDGTSWLPVFTSTVPPARFDHSLAYDRVRDRLVLFGGRNGSTYLGDTWEWDTMDWVQHSTTPSPSPRAMASIAYDTCRNVTVLFGGNSPGSGLLGDTWEWNGTLWAQRFPTHVPPARDGALMAFDAARRRAVIFGGRGNGGAYFGDVWEWDGTDWTLRVTSVSPRPRTDAPLAFDANRREIVMFGGIFSDRITWRYAPTDPAIYTPSQSGCPGSAGTPTLTIATPSGYPWLGEPFTVAVTNLAPGHPAAMAAGLSNTQWAGIPLPLSLSFIGMFGCQALCSAEFFFPMPPADPSGTTTWTLGPIPNDPGFLGFRFFTQAWVADAVNPAGLIVSNLGEAVVGGK